MTPQEAIELIESERKTMYLPKSEEYISDFGYALEMAINALEQTRWIPVKWHIKTEVEEYEQYPEGTVMLDCPMPTEGEDVLITIKGKSGQVWVEKDIALKDEDGWYTDGGYEWVDDIIAWMPLPQPYNAESEDK